MITDNKVILIVDDELDILELLRNFLKKAGYRAMTASSGRVALEKAKEHPDLILLDIVMPGGLDGYEVLSRLKCGLATKNIPVIMLTAKSESASIFKAQNLDVTDYIIKPCNPSELLKVVKKYI